MAQKPPEAFRRTRGDGCDEDVQVVSSRGGRNTKIHALAVLKGALLPPRGAPAGGLAVASTALHSRRDNPLGARAMYRAGRVYRIHGTNAPDHQS
jgi:hypothetical protein